MRLIPALISTLLLTGCLGTFMTPSSMTAPQGPKRSASPKPSTSASPVTTSGAVSLPTTVRLEMPSTVIGTGGLNVIGTGGLNVIGTGGLNVIATGGLNYQVQQSGIASLQILQAVEKYHDVTQQIDKLLKAVASLPLENLKPLQVKDPGGRTMTVMVGKKTDHAVLTVTAEGQELRMAFTSPRKGKLVLRALKGGNQWHFATEFDLDAGRVTADRATDYNLTSGAVDLGHWEFQRHATPEKGKAFGFKMWAYDDRPGKGDTRITLANFLADDRAVLVYGGREPDGSWFYLHPTDPAADSKTLHPHYLNTQGDDTASATDAAELQALVPTEADFKAMATADPSTGSPLERPVFTFPE